MSPEPSSTKAPAKGLIKTARSSPILVKLLKGLAVTAVAVAPYAAFLLLPRIFGGAEPQGFYTSHLGSFILPAVPILYVIVYIVISRNRLAPPKKGSRRAPKPPLPPLGQRLRDNTSIIATLDTPTWRIIYAVAFIGAVVAAGITPLDVDLISTVADDPDAIRPLLIGAGVPVAAYALILGRVGSINRTRTDAIDLIYAIGRDTLKYPKTTPARPTRRQMQLSIPTLAVSVKKWRGLYEIDRAFVLAPEELSVQDTKLWDEFDVNLNAKAPREEEWRVQRDPRGRGALIGPANYPTAILWDGAIDSDPLTFILGENLETGETLRITFNEASPHMAISGGTSSGKTSGAEIIAAQVLIKPMPWDPDLYGQVVIVDPKGPFARRWIGRPGVVVANGQEDSAVDVSDTGGPLTGPVVMASCMEWIEQEHQRRASVLAKFPDAATWVHLPDEVKKAERFAPMVIILDEYIDHTDMEKGDDVRIEMENHARAVTTRMASWHARKYRNVGMHTILIAQRVNMGVIGNVLMGNLPARLITGQMDQAQLTSMFQTDMVPSLPSSRRTPEGAVKSIPGRARFMNALGQPIQKIQIPWFGGKTNSDTLDKWLPRGPKPLNGDFTFPDAHPRRASEFDDEGNLIEHSTAAAISENSTPTTHPSSAGTVDGDLAADDLIPEAPSNPAPRSTEPDADAIFPAEHVETIRCSTEGCVNDADGDCGACEKPTCRYHLDRPVEPGDGIPVCEECRASHPINASGAGPVWDAIQDGIDGTEMSATFTRISDDSVKIIVAAPRGKVVVVTAETGTITAQSRSGVSTGLEDVLDRVLLALQYQRDQAAAEQPLQPTPGGES